MCTKIQALFGFLVGLPYVCATADWAVRDRRLVDSYGRDFPLLKRERERERERMLRP